MRDQCHEGIRNSEWLGSHWKPQFNPSPLHSHLTLPKAYTKMLCIDVMSSEQVHASVQTLYISILHSREDMITPDHAITPPQDPHKSYTSRILPPT
jgi:hypothetical protein